MSSLKRRRPLPRRKRPEPNFAYEQPRRGDMVANCGHQEALDRKVHWFIAEGAEIVPPGGRAIPIRWVAACDPCYRRSMGNVDRILIKDVFAWASDDEDVIVATPGEFDR